MADNMNRNVGRYWLLYYQPRPEDGERIVLAFVIEENGKAKVYFDSEFSKLHKIFPATDIESLHFILESLRSDLTGISDIPFVLDTYGPQIVASKPRQIVLPISDEIVAMLLGKYILPSKAIPNERKRKADATAKEIEAYVRSELRFGASVKTDVGSKEILGHKVPGIGRVALAIPRAAGWTLIDGVDLNKLTPQAAINRADDIARTYWNYGRVRVEKGIPIQRVGVVLNGKSHLRPKTHEAHDYALHRFQSDSDLAIDNASAESAKELVSLLQIQSEN